MKWETTSFWSFTWQRQKNHINKWNYFQNQLHFDIMSLLMTQILKIKFLKLTCWWFRLRYGFHWFEDTVADKAVPLFISRTVLLGHRWRKGEQCRDLLLCFLPLKWYLWHTPKKQKTKPQHVVENRKLWDTEEGRDRRIYEINAEC